MTLDLESCLRAKSEEGRITKEKAEKAIQQFEELKQDFQDSLLAGDTVAAQTADSLKRKKWTRLHELIRQNQAIQRLDNLMERGVPVERILRSYFDMSSSGSVGEESIFRSYSSIRELAIGKMAQVIEQFEPRVAGIVDPENTPSGQTKIRNIVREAFGEDSGDREAREMAKGISEGLEFLRQEFNRNGGNIDFRQDFGLPQLHDSSRIAEVSKQEWINDIMPRLDRDKMIDFSTGQPMTEEQINNLLDATYDNIVTNGLSDLDPTVPGRGNKITTKRQHMRFLQFRSADDWLDYQRRFGPNDGNIVTTLTGHVDKMAIDIAQMRVLGPNPRGAINVLANTVRNRTGSNFEGMLGRNLMEVNGEANQPETPASERAAAMGVSARNFLTASLLGQAFFSALTDFPFSQVAARFAGLDAARLARRHAQLMVRQKSGKKHLNRMGIVAESQMEKAIAANRISGEVLGTRGVSGLSRRVSDTVMRASLLQPWTEAARGAFKEEILSTLTENAGKSITELPEPLRKTLKRNGISAEKWDAIRSAPRFQLDDTSDIIRPFEVMQKNREAAFALQRFLNSETEFAVPTGLTTVRSMLRGGTKPGTLLGEFARSAGLFKNFIATVTALQFGRFAQIEGGLNKARYTATLALTTGAFGIIAEQLSQLADGKKPLTMDPTTSKGRANVLQGLWRAGTFGVVSDIVFTDFQKFGTSLGETLSGPVVSELLGPGVNLTVGNVRELVTEEGSLREPLRTTDAGRELLDFTQSLTPGQNLWWTNLATQRLIFDQMQKLVDPEAAKSFQRLRQRAEDQGTGFFEGLAPGETPF